ncbi:MAG TPA: hypothetical protein VKY37_12935 [Brumimicrobium sp.]|nr:hypothetical protein [Brumimicrobium sp.]
MKTLNYLYAFILILFSFSAFGQDEKPVKRIAITDVQVYGGMLFKNDINGTLSDFRSLAPQSYLLNKDFSNFSQEERKGSSGDMGSSIMIGIQFRDKNNSTYRANPFLRLGFNYSAGSTIAGSMRSSSITPYDTLTSSQTGNAIYVDSTESNSYGMFYSSDQLRFDGSLIFRTNPDARWSVYAGVGVTVGISLNASARIHYTKRRDVNMHGYGAGNPSGSHYISPTEFKYEELRNKTNFSLSTYVPLGIDFRLSNRNKFWSRIHLFYEVKPAVNFVSIPELYTVTNTSFQHGLGVRVSWN